ncbi:hypothetical protein TRICI_002307 [Trichomonascus ciferrii]|uniref:Uncharacterized protein n=1 Tax=Trichomonascus ciferrii TaxID=44093 RepID=A0A642V687_9ASCO|nr:hypothetical protein TRICI_002307 [Trichomonascus ciferrii]
MSSEDPKYANAEQMAQTNPSALESGGVAVAPQPATRTASPSPLGLLSFGITTFILGLYHCGAGLPNSDPSAGPGPDTAIIGMALFMGGAAQFAAGMWEFKVGNIFGATAFTSYGAFWLSYSAFKIEAFGVAAGYKGDERALSYALGIYLTLWGFLTLCFFLCALRTSIGLLSTLGTLIIAFLFLAISEFLKTNNAGSAVGMEKAGGAMSVICAACAFYTGVSKLMVPEFTYLRLPEGHLA